MKLTDVYASEVNIPILYFLLLERTKEQCISHKGEVLYPDHCDFVASRPYIAWYIIEHDGKKIGAIYLSKNREIGVFLFEKFKMQGLGAQAVKLIMEAHPGRFLANIAPTNPGSAEFFKNLGFKHIQQTYELEQP